MKSDTPTSPNIAPATKHDAHDGSSSQMKRSNITKYCACHEKWSAWLILVTHETSSTKRGATGVSLQDHKFCTCRTILNSRFERKIREFFSADGKTIRPWSEHGPAISSPFRTRHFRELTPSSWRRILHEKKPFALRLSPKISRRAGPAKRSQTQTSPNTAPATKNASRDWSSSRMKGPVQCAEREESCSGITKYCACQEILSSSFDGKSCHESHTTTSLNASHTSLLLSLYSSLLYCSQRFSTLLYSTLFYSTLLYPTLLFSAILLYFTLLYSILLDSAVFYSTIYSSVLFCTLVYSYLLYSILLFSTLLSATLPYPIPYFCSLLIYTPSSVRHQPWRNCCVYRIHCAWASFWL